MLEDPSELLALAVNMALLAWAYGANRLSIAVFDYQRRSGRDPFLYQVAMTRSDIRLLLIGTPIILQQLLLSSDGVNTVKVSWLNVWSMQVGLTLVMGTQLESSLLLSLASLDRRRALRSTGAPYFKHPSYKVLPCDVEEREKRGEAVEALAERRIWSCLVAGYSVVWLVYLACVYDEGQRSLPRGILPRCLAVHLLPPALRTQQMEAEVCRRLRSPGIPGVPSYANRPPRYRICRMEFYPSTYPALVVVLVGSVLASCLCCALFVATFARTIRASAKKPTPHHQRQDAKVLGARKMAAVMVCELSFVLLGIVSLALIGVYGDGMSTPVTTTATAFINFITLQSNFFSFFALSRIFRKDMWEIVKDYLNVE